MSNPRPLIDCLAELSALLGEGGVLTPADGLDRYEEDARRGRGRAAAVLRPRSTDEVSKVVALAYRERIQLVVQGANTSLNGASTPDHTGEQVVLSLERLNQPPDVDAGNRSVTVGAGVRLSQLNSVAEAFNLTFPIDLAADPSVGGMLAANTGGARFIRYGDVRRNVLGVEVVLFDEGGTVLDLNRPLWKNNSGLDLKQLFVGSSGALGVITRATLALQSLPAARQAALIVPTHERDLIEILVALERNLGPLLTAFEGMSGAAMAAALEHAPNLRNPFAGGEQPSYALLIEIAGPPTLAGHLFGVLEQALAPLWDGATPLIADALIGPPEAFWALRHAIPEGQKRMGQVIGCDIALTRGQVARFRAEMSETIAARWPDLVICDFGHVGDGGLHFNMVAPRALGGWTAEAVEEVKAAVFEKAVSEFGGSFSAEHGLGPKNLDYYVTYVSEAERRAAGALQGALTDRMQGRVNFGATNGVAR